MKEKTFREVLKSWMNEMDFWANKTLEDGTPRLGKFESEELYRYGKKFLEELDTPKTEKVVVEHFERIGEISQCRRIYVSDLETAKKIFSGIDRYHEEGAQDKFNVQVTEVSDAQPEGTVEKETP